MCESAIGSQPPCARAEARLGATRDFLARLTKLVYIDPTPALMPAAGAEVGVGCRPTEDAVPPHLSFSAVPGLLDDAWKQFGRAAAGQANGHVTLARWMASLDRLNTSMAALHAAGAIPRSILDAYLALVAENRPLIEDWQAQATFSIPPG